MSPQVLQIKRLEVSRMPGFPSGFQLKNDFSSGFNIITGPNASGKSSFARAIQQVIWNDLSQRYTLTALANTGNDQWRFDLDAGFLRAQRNGNPEIFQPPLAEDRPRYLLALHDLIIANEAELATEIHRQLSGGYDLQAAARELSFNSSVAGRRISSYVQLKEASNEVIRIQDEQRKLHKDKQGLARLANERDVIEKKLQLEKCLEKARSMRQADDRLKKAQEKLINFPDVMRFFRASDYEDAKKFEEQIAKIEGELLKQNEAIESTKAKINELKLPDQGVEEVIERELQPLLREIEELVRDKKIHREKLIAATARRESAASELGVAEPNRDWPGISLTGFADLENAWLTIWQDVSREIALQSEIELLRENVSNISGNSAEPDKVKQGIYLLTRWLQSQGRDEHKKPSLWPALALGVLAVAAALTGTFLSEYWLAPFVALVAVLIIFLAQKSRGNTEFAGENNLLNEYNQLGLSEPLKPDISFVQEQIEKLIRQWTVAENAREAGIRIAQLQRELRTTEENLVRFQKKLDEQRSALGLVAEEVNSQSKAAISLLIKHFSSWLKARNECLEVQSLLDACEEKYVKKLLVFNEGLQRLNREPANGLNEAISVLDALKKASQIRSEAIGQMSFAQKEEQRQSKLLIETKQMLLEIYTRLGIDEGNKYLLREYHVQWHDFQNAVAEVNDSQRDFSRIKDDLESLEAYQKQKNWVDSLSAEGLEKELQAFYEMRQRRDAILDEIGKTNGKIDQSQRDGLLEAALLKQERCFEELETAFEANLLSLTGSAVVNALQKANHEKNDSLLFQKADQLFRKITHYQFSLRIPDGADQAFRAFDEVRQTGLSLEELSTGTRIQLLMAVRLAYIETHENSYRLPLLADELLANTDDIRAAAIIEALAEISRSGRQVFYFTAQADEVMKWQNYLDGQPDIDYTVISLEGKAGERLDFSDLVNSPKPDTVIPKPASSDYISYGSLLEVPVFNLLLNSIEELHIWHLVDDLEILYQLLIIRIRFWGQLKQLSADAPSFFKGNWSSFFEKVQRKAALVSDFQELFKKGRNVPVNRKILLDSGAVSDNFIAAVSALLNEVKGDPEMLLLQLENKAVSGFRQNRLEDLRNYLSSEGFLSDEKKPDEQELLNQFYVIAARHQVSTYEADTLLRVLGISKSD